MSQVISVLLLGVVGFVYVVNGFLFLGVASVLSLLFAIERTLSEVIKKLSGNDTVC